MAEENKEKDKKREGEQAQATMEELENNEKPILPSKEDKFILEKLYPSSEARNLGLLEAWEENKSPYVIITLFKDNDGNTKFLIETRNGFNIKDFLFKELNCRWNPKKKVWYKEARLTTEEFVEMMRKMESRVSGIVVVDSHYKQIRRVFEGRVRVEVPAPEDKPEREVTKTEHVETTPKPSKAPEPQAVEPAPEADTLNPESDIPIAEVSDDDLALAPIEEKTSKEKEEAHANKEEKEAFVMPYREMKDKMKEIENVIQKAINDLVKIIDEGALVYVHMKKNSVNLAVDKAYNKREKLKELGYKYNPMAHTWEKYIKREDYEKEMENLHKIGIHFIMPVGASPEVAKREMEKSINNRYHKYRGGYNKSYKGGKSKTYNKNHNAQKEQNYKKYNYKEPEVGL